MLVNCWGPDKHLILVLSHDNVVVWSLSRVRLFCDPVDCSPPGSSVHRILQARILERVAIFFSRGSSRPRDRIHISCIGRWVCYR